MQIVFQAPSAAAVTLAGTAREAENDFALSFADQVQVAALFRAVKAKIFHRGNRVYSVGWSTTRQHASESAAESFLINHAEAITPATGTLTFTKEDATTWTLNPAVVAIAGSRRIGLTTTHSYQAQGTTP
jgi:hypothetical protein